MTKIKLCGIRRPEEIAVVNQLRPDYIGFVFAKRSRRAVTRREAAVLKERLEGGILTVGVFVDEDPEAVLELLRDGVIDLVQLHGREDEDYIAALKAKTEQLVIKAFRIQGEEDLEEAERCGADHILLDSGAGTGKTFDWNCLKPAGRPYFLAGGLDPDNVEAAILQLSPYAVDVSSGIETDGIKDPAKMRLFTENVRKADGMLKEQRYNDENGRTNE